VGPCDTDPAWARSLDAGGATRCPAKPGLDAPGPLHHVILRGLARGTILVGAEERAAVVARRGALATATGTRSHAWDGLPNHTRVSLRYGSVGQRRFVGGNRRYGTLVRKTTYLPTTRAAIAAMDAMIGDVGDGTGDGA
jgi:hypothetical protein